MEKYLKGFLLARGWTLEKTHDLTVLLDEAKKHAATFARFEDLAQAPASGTSKTDIPAPLCVTCRSSKPADAALKWPS